MLHFQVSKVSRCNRALVDDADDTVETVSDAGEVSTEFQRVHIVTRHPAELASHGSVHVEETATTQRHVRWRSVARLADNDRFIVDRQPIR